MQTHIFISLGDNAPFGFFSIFFTTSNLITRLDVYASENYPTYLDFDLDLNGSLFFLGCILILVLVEEVDSDAKLVTNPVDAGSLSTNDTSNEFLSNFELSDIAVDNFIVLGVSHNLLDLVDSLVDIGTNPTDLDHVLSVGIANFRAELDG